MIKYMNERNPDWFHFKMDSAINSPNDAFTLEECQKIADALDDIAAKLHNAACEIRDAKVLDFHDMPEDEQQRYLDF